MEFGIESSGYMDRTGESARGEPRRDTPESEAPSRLAHWSRLAEQGLLRPCRVLRDRQWLVRAHEDIAAVHFLSSGVVELSQESADGVSRVFRMVSAPALLSAEEALAGLSEHETSICAVGEATVHRVERCDFMRWIAGDTNLAQETLEEVSHGSVASARFSKAPIAETEKLLANLLVAYVESFGSKGPTGWTIGLRRSQSDFAARVGAAERSVNRVLRVWRQQAVISKHKGQYVIHQLDYLLRASEDLRATQITQRTKAPRLRAPVAT